jgi:hypothetical protein
VPIALSAKSGQTKAIVSPPAVLSISGVTEIGSRNFQPNCLYCHLKLLVSTMLPIFFIFYLLRIFAFGLR